MNIETINKFVNELSKTSGIHRNDLIRCAPKKIRNAFLFKNVVRETHSTDYTVSNGVAIGKQEDGNLVGLTVDEIEDCRFKHIPYQLPENLNSKDTTYTDEIRSYICEDSEDEN